jgi:hypothetical protein
MVRGSCPPHKAVLQFDQQLFAELVEKLMTAGIIKEEKVGGA